jgi:hypothetical protein
MFVAHVARIVAKTGGTLVARLCFQNQTLSILPSVSAVSQKATITTLAHVSLRNRASAA